MNPALYSFMFTKICYGNCQMREWNIYVTEPHTSNGGEKTDDENLRSIGSCLLQLQLWRLLSISGRCICGPAVVLELFWESDAELGWRTLSKSAEMLFESVSLGIVDTGQDQNFHFDPRRGIALLLLQLQHLYIYKNTRFSCEPRRLRPRTWLHAARRFRLHGPRGRTQVGEWLFFSSIAPSSHFHLFSSSSSQCLLILLVIYEMHKSVISCIQELGHCNNIHYFSPQPILRFSF